MRDGGYVWGVTVAAAGPTYDALHEAVVVITRIDGELAERFGATPTPPIPEPV